MSRWRATPEQNRRYRKALVKRNNEKYRDVELPLCACGCGNPVTIHRDKGIPNKYLNHHGKKGKKASPELRAKMSEVMKRVHAEVGVQGSFIGKHEKRILDDMEQELESKIYRQVWASGNYVDGYCPELNLAIEIDEPFHRWGDAPNVDAERQAKIEADTGWRFLRVPIDHEGRLVA